MKRILLIITCMFIVLGSFTQTIVTPPNGTIMTTRYYDNLASQFGSSFTAYNFIYVNSLSNSYLITGNYSASQTISKAIVDGNFYPLNGKNVTTVSDTAKRYVAKKSDELIFIKAGIASRDTVDLSAMPIGKQIEIVNYGGAAGVVLRPGTNIYLDGSTSNATYTTQKRITVFRKSSTLIYTLNKD